jgi:hypothetical protein
LYNFTSDQREPVPTSNKLHSALASSDALPRLTQTTNVLEGAQIGDSDHSSLF